MRLGWKGHRLFSLSRGPEPSRTELHRFPNRVVLAHTTALDHIIVALKGQVFLSTDRGITFAPVLRLSHPWSLPRREAFIEDPAGNILLGEYGNARNDAGRWISTAWLHRSTDEGQSWESSKHFVQAGVNKHVHAITVDGSGRVLVSTGDRRKQTWVGQPPGPSAETDLHSWTLLTRRPWQLGGYTCAASTDLAIYWGTDYWLGTNYIVAESSFCGPRRWALGGKLKRNPVSSMISVGAEVASFVVAASTNQYGRAGGTSAILSYDERADRWTTLVAPMTEGRSGIAQCRADPIQDTVHLIIAGRSYHLTVG